MKASAGASRRGPKHTAYRGFMDSATSSTLPLIRRRVLGWYRSNGRVFPWRYRTDPWQVLLAELLLQRTRADLVDPVYVRVLDRWPTAAALAEANPHEVATALKPLGFEHRNERIQVAASACKHGVPRSLRGLLDVRGVGRYAATATLCFAFGRRMAVVDPAVIRVLDRLGLVSSKHARPREDSAVWAVAQALVPTRNARTWNYAILDFGATVCRAVPRCSECPLVALCPTGRDISQRSVGETLSGA
jgi:A/G-specific adenine glycosylase